MKLYSKMLSDVTRLLKKRTLDDLYLSDELQPEIASLISLPDTEILEWFENIFYDFLPKFKLKQIPEYYTSIPEKEQKKIITESRALHSLLFIIKRETLLQ